MERASSIFMVADAVRGMPLDLGAQTSPDGAVTLLFSDIEGSTEIIERLGDRQSLDVLRDHDEVVRT